MLAELFDHIFDGHNSVARRRRRSEALGRPARSFAEFAVAGRGDRRVGRGAV